jgi:hypothetical protein
MFSVFVPAPFVVIFPDHLLDWDSGPRDDPEEAGLVRKQDRDKKGYSRKDADCRYQITVLSYQRHDLFGSKIRKLRVVVMRDGLKLVGKRSCPRDKKRKRDGAEYEKARDAEEDYGKEVCGHNPDAAVERFECFFVFENDSTVIEAE